MVEWLVRGVLAISLLISLASGSDAASLTYFTRYDAFGTIDALGNENLISSGIQGAGFYTQLQFAPDGTLYAFGGLADMGSTWTWGRVDPSTGAFTQIGDFRTDLPGFIGTQFADFRDAEVGFDSAGHMLVSYVTTSQFGSGMNQRMFGTVDVSTGTFTERSRTPAGNAIDSFATSRQGVTYFTRYDAFGTIDALGNEHLISPGIQGAGFYTQLQFAPDGTLYAFGGVMDMGSTWTWGRVDPATGAFTQIGDFRTDLPGFIGTQFADFRDAEVGFDSAGHMLVSYVTTSQFGSGMNQRMFGIVDVSTGTFTERSRTPAGNAIDSFATARAAVPEPTLVATSALGVAALLRSARRPATRRPV